MMQHIASREALEATNQHLLEVSEPLTGVGLAALGSDLDGVSDLLLTQVSLRRTLSENTLSPEARAGIVDRLLGRQDQRAGAGRGPVRGPAGVGLLPRSAGRAAPAEPHRDVPAGRAHR